MSSAPSADEREADEPPVAALFADVVGQGPAVAVLRAAARRPVHSYLFLGPRGSSRRLAARGFAAALLCPSGGCGTCSHCRRALAGTHPDLVVVERVGAAVGIDEARRISALAQRRPFEAERQVIVVADVHLAVRSAPALLKTLEEPPATTFFVLLGENVPPELVTVASRCAAVEFRAVPPAEVEAWLAEQGVDAEQAAQIARWSGGDVERARILAEDPEASERAALWRSIPGRLDGSGVAAAKAAREVLAAADSAVEHVRQRHAAELQHLAEQAEQWGEKGLPGRREILDRHRREERQWRIEELEAGLAALARAYGHHLQETLANGVRPPASEAVAASRLADAAGAADAVGLITETAEALTRNPNELLLLEALFLRLARD